MILQTLAALVCYLFFVGTATLIARRVTKLPVAIAFPLAISILTIFLYLGDLLGLATLISLIESLLFCTILLMFFKRHNSEIQIPKIPPAVVIVIFLLTLVLSIPRLAYPLSLVKHTILFSGIGDETKHLAVLTGIAASRGSVPLFPYDPGYPFAYYYFYYLIPGKVLSLFGQASFGTVWLIHVALSQFFTMYIAAALIWTVTKKRFLRILGLGMAIFGTSWKLIPNIFHWYGIHNLHIEHWWQMPGNPVFGQNAVLGWQITHPITLDTWTPQHMWAGALTTVTALILISQKRTASTFVMLAVLLAAIIGVSIQAGFALFAALGIWVIAVDRKYIIPWFLTGAAAVIADIPLFILLSGNHLNLRFSPYLPSLPNIPTLLGTILFYLIETGPALPILIFLWFRKKQTGPPLLFLATGVIATLILSRLFTDEFNDLSMRATVVAESLLPALTVWLLEISHIRNKIRYFIFTALIVSVIISAAAGGLEVSFQTRAMETYPAILTDIYRVTQKFTRVTDVVVFNDAYLADRLPLIAGRMTIESVYSFGNDVYAPLSIPVGRTYQEQICAVFDRLIRRRPTATIVYGELSNTAPLTCAGILKRKNAAGVLFSSPAFTLYRL